MKAIIFFLQESNKTMFATIDVWRRTAYAYGVDCYIGIDETENHDFAYWEDQHCESHIVNSLDEALSVHPQLKKVLITQNASTSIKQFTHPKDNVVYIFGPDGRDIETGISDFEVKLDFPYKLWSIQACSIVLYDRSIKI